MGIKAHPQYNLQAIYFRNSSAVLKKDFHIQDYEGPLIGSFKVTKCDASIMEDQSIIEAIVSFEFSYSDSEPKADDIEVKDPLLTIKADIAVRYSFGEDGLPSQSDLNIWTSRNSILHAWPYWREYSQSAQLRMGAPLTTMPLMHPPQSRKSEQ